MNLIRRSLRLKYTIPRAGFEGDLSTSPGGGHPASPASRRLKPSSPSSHTVTNKQPRNSNVVTTEGRPIKGLYAAGEIAGGVHGNNSLDGNSLLDCVVFGRVSGKHCAEYMLGEIKPASLAHLSGKLAPGGAKKVIRLDRFKFEQRMV